MSTRIRIERLVLDGIELSRRERDALGPAIARELRQLAGGQGDRSDEPQHRGASPVVEEIAREVAAAVHGATPAPAHRASPARRAAPAARPAPGVPRGGRR